MRSKKLSKNIKVTSAKPIKHKKISSSLMAYKIHNRRDSYMLAVADKNLVGKILKVKGKEDFFINPRFYFEKEADEKEIIQLIQNCSSANLVGKNSVNTGIKAGFVIKENIIKIKGIPHAQIVVMA